jgi:ABC-type antimicrobial peptide transport system permease subunit
MPLAVGLGLGLAGAVGVGRLVRGFLVHTGPADPPTLGGLAALLAFVATCAVVIPARRAARIEPSTALRHE